MLPWAEADIGLLPHPRWSWKPLTITKKRSILDVTAVLDPPLMTWNYSVTINVAAKAIKLVFYEKVPQTLNQRKSQSLDALQ